MTVFPCLTREKHPDITGSKKTPLRKILKGAFTQYPICTA